MPRSRCEVAIFVVSCSDRIRVTPVTTAPPGHQLRPAPDCIVLDVLTSMRFTAAVNRAAVASHGRSNVQRHSRTDDDCLLRTPVIHGR